MTRCGDIAIRNFRNERSVGCWSPVGRQYNKAFYHVRNPPLEMYMWQTHTQTNISKTKHFPLGKCIFIVCRMGRWSFWSWQTDRRGASLNAAFCSHRRHRPGALQVGSTGITFATWEYLTSLLTSPSEVTGHQARDLLLNRNWSFHGAVGRRLAVGRFRRKVRQSGMH